MFTLGLLVYVEARVLLCVVSASVTLVDQDHVGWRTLETNCTDN